MKPFHIKPKKRRGKKFKPDQAYLDKAKDEFFKGGGKVEKLPYQGVPFEMGLELFTFHAKHTSSRVDITELGEREKPRKVVRGLKGEKLSPKKRKYYYKRKK